MNSAAYFIVWLQELSELRAGGLVSDEDYAFSRAERLDALLQRPGKPWRKWLFAGVPLSLGVGGALAFVEQQREHFLMAGAITAFCLLAAVGTYSRVMATHLSPAQRLEILRDLLERDLVTADEFADFEHRIIAED